MADSNRPWEECSAWKTESQYFQWLRGALRKLWSDYPLRKEWKTRALRPVTREERIEKVFHPSTKNVGQCVNCGNWFPGSKLEVDHKVPSEGCRDYETASKFLWYCAGLTGEHFQLSCKPCHKIKSHAERYNMTFEEAKVAKQVIEFGKKPLTNQVKFLNSVGVELEKSTKKECKEKYSEYLKLNGGS